MSDVQVLYGDSLDVLPTLDAASVDAVCTDPPYELAFMGRTWDASGIAYNVELWRECLRVLKPGGYLLAFGGTRTHHRLACAVEDAGFEIRDSIAWLYGSGFPKSLDVSKAIDKRRDWSLVERLSEEIRRARIEAGLSLAEIGEAMLAATDGTYGKWYHRGGHMFFETGRNLPSRPEWEHLRHVLPVADEFAEAYDEAEREVISQRAGSIGRGNWRAMEGRSDQMPDQFELTAPATDDARRWQGWGTALKPAHEPIVVARKPLTGTVAANVLEHGTGALNIDVCRVEPNGESRRRVGEASQDTRYTDNGGTNFAALPGVRGGDPAGRWPPNVVLDEAVAAELDRQSGISISTDRPRHNTAEAHNRTASMGKSSADWTTNGYEDSGGTSRFFPIFRYEAKAPADERPRANGTSHPTVKPLELVRWLVRLVTPPGGLVLDPFAGSGTTGEACIIEGFQCVLIEREADYLPLIRARLDKPIQMTLGGGAA